MTYIIQEELQNALKCLEQALKQYESLQTAWQLKEANYVKIQVELISKNDALRAQSQELSQNLIKVQSDFKIFKDSHEGCGDRITAYRSVAKALESENQLLAGEKNHLEQFKIQYCNNNGALKVAVDQVDSLRRQILLKDEEVKRLRKHCDHEEVEKIKIVQKLAQVEEEIDQKTFYVRNLNSQLSNKADTLEALRIAKRDIELRLQNQMTENILMKDNLSKLKRTEERVEALESELIMQESIYESRMKDMQRSLDLQIDEINQNKDKEVETIKSQYINLFHEKAEELLTLRSDYQNVVKKTEQQSRTISDLEYKEEELNTLLSKKQACHHREFESTFHEMQSEMKKLQDLTQKSEIELTQLRLKFQDLKENDSKILNQEKNDVIENDVKLQAPIQTDLEDSGIVYDSDHSKTRKKRGKRKRKNH